MKIREHLRVYLEGMANYKNETLEEFVNDLVEKSIWNDLEANFTNYSVKTFMDSLKHTPEPNFRLLQDRKDVFSFWVKSYDDYNRLTVNPEHANRDAAYHDYEEKKDSGKYYFVQMGAYTSEGPIVLNEYRKP